MTRTELLSLLRFIERTRLPARDCLGLRCDDPVWSMVLFLLERHLTGRLVTITSLAGAAGVPYATALRRANDLFAEGLIDRRPRGPSGRSFAIEPTEALIARVETYAAGIKAEVAQAVGGSGAPGERFYFGGAYLSARIIPAPAPEPAIGAMLGDLSLLLKRQPTFSALFRLRAELRQMAGCPIRMVLAEFDALHAALLDNAARAVSDHDVVGFTFGWLGEMVAAGALLPLDDRIDAEGLGVPDFYPAAWEAAQYEGVQYGIPIEPVAEMLCYRADLFEAAGLAPPLTIEALLKAGRALHRPERGIHGISWCAARGQALGQTFLQILSDFDQPPLALRRIGDQIDLSDLGGEARRPAFATPAAADAAEYLRALLAISPPDILEMDWDGRLRAYAEGRAAMSYNWSSRTAEFESDPTSPARGRTGYLPHPAGAARPSIAPVGGYALAIPANLDPARRDGAWRAIRWLTSPAMAKLLAINGASVSPRISVAADPEVTELNPVIRVVDSLARTDRLQRWPHAPVAEFSRIAAIVGEELHAMLAGDCPPRAALARVQGRVDRMMRAAGHY